MSKPMIIELIVNESHLHSIINPILYFICKAIDLK